MVRFIFLGAILVFLGVYFFWTEILLQERVLKKKKIEKIVTRDKLGVKTVEYRRIPVWKSLQEVIRDITSLQRKFIIVMLFLLGILTYLLMFGMFCHYDINKKKFVETDNSWRNYFYK